jgi:phosphatidylserine/phosphatidylglycerophosphate/cardiolipin synthase-like enzyme
MPQVFDNIEQSLLPALQSALNLSDKADFCVGYFNLRGWKELDDHIQHWSETDGACRLLVGMQKPPQDQLREMLSIMKQGQGIDNQTAIRIKKQLAEEFRRQLTLGAPNNEDEAGLRKLASRLKEKKVIVKLFLRHPLHAKLYLLFRSDPINPIIGYLGSSNLTMAGLAGQGELNIDVLDHDATLKLAQWFENRWNDRFCIDISKELIQIVEESWAREDLIPPYHIY